LLFGAAEHRLSGAIASCHDDDDDNDDDDARNIYFITAFILFYGCTNHLILKLFK